jgi:hypothetical protein
VLVPNHVQQVSKSGQDIMNNGLSFLHICILFKHIFGPFTPVPYHEFIQPCLSTEFVKHSVKLQVKEMMNLQREVKRKCLRRTQAGPWSIED